MSTSPMFLDNCYKLITNTTKPIYFPLPLMNINRYSTSSFRRSPLNTILEEAEIRRWTGGLDERECGSWNIGHSNPII